MKNDDPLRLPLPCVLSKTSPCVLAPRAHVAQQQQHTTTHNNTRRQSQRETGRDREKTEKEYNVFSERGNKIETAHVDEQVNSEKLFRDCQFVDALEKGVGFMVWSKRGSLRCHVSGSWACFRRLVGPKSKPKGGRVISTRLQEHWDDKPATIAVNVDSRLDLFAPTPRVQAIFF